MAGEATRGGWEEPDEVAQVAQVVQVVLHQVVLVVGAVVAVGHASKPPSVG